jgi:hypothetical protein
MPLLVASVKSAVVCKVPPLKIILSTSALPGVAPKLADDDIFKIPKEIVVEPV